MKIDRDASFKDIIRGIHNIKDADYPVPPNQKHILRNQTVSRNRKRIIVMTSINFERVSFFLEQLREHISFQWISTLNINEIHPYLQHSSQPETSCDPYELFCKGYRH